ncbi:NTPase KAP family P-loop domain-containing protein 1-like [Liasis olivaceus]
MEVLQTSVICLGEKLDAEICAAFLKATLRSGTTSVLGLEPPESQVGVGLGRFLTMGKAMAKHPYLRLRDEGAAPGQQEKSNKYIYCEALAKTLEDITPPVTVGFYAPWGRKRSSLLDRIEGKHQGSHADHQKLFKNFILFHSSSRQKKISKNGVRYVFISFNAWEYVGCDYTWAGIVTTLVDEIEVHHKWCFAAFRYFGADFQETANGKEWTFKTWGSIFFGGFLFVFVFLIPLVSLLSEVAPVPLAGGALASILAPFLPIFKNFIFTVKKNMQREMNRKDLGTQLGFMHSVKKEVETMIKFLKVLELHEKNEIRVVLRITNLDLCAPDKVVSVLDAIQILLSDPTAPFISILAADPSILVNCIQQSSNTWSNGYLYLDRIVSLQFSLPPMNHMEKRKLLSKALKTKHQEVCTTAEQKDVRVDVEGNENEAKNGSVESPGFRLLKSKEDDMSKVASAEETDRNNKVADFRCLVYDKLKDSDYLPGNYVEMNRVVNTAITIQHMLELGYECDSELREMYKENLKEVIIDWVILANAWPCRLSWLLQCEEDKRQRASLHENRAADQSSTGTSGDGQGAATGGDESLFSIYKKNCNNLDEIKEEVKELLELDQDPDLFEDMLQKNKTCFTAKGAKSIPNLLINLDFSLKRTFELLEDLHNTGDKMNKI